MRTRLASQVAAIRHWKIYNKSYLCCPDSEATWFVDPPYETTGKPYQCGSDCVDYRELGEWCRKRRGLTIVCESQSATWLPFEPLAAWRSNVNGKMSKEAVWVSQPPRID